ncbi:M1 family metallopeptidase [Bryobacter aggregatus]|uniref:M1 family metallopeptidase n=1 Tax=Bryobacter aggregatus TaxID=360054 RepID=UPI0004E15726|nr:M1 family metallopeptidase [Bryobacter aggregatus]
MRLFQYGCVWVTISLLSSCAPKLDQEKPSMPIPKDEHSYAVPAEAISTHLDLYARVDFERKVISGTATHRVKGKGKITLDTKDLKIFKTESSIDGVNFHVAEYKLGPSDKILGAPLEINLSEGTKFVRVSYETSPSAVALQWLSEQQTAGKQSPYLYTQGQPIYTRSWIPLQDSPGIRITYKAKVETEPNFFAVMSAPNDQRTSAPTGSYSFDMTQRIPPYLIALAVGEIQFRLMGGRTGIYAEKQLLDAATKEFEDLDAMVRAAEQLFGSYRWDRYDVLILPPSFPIGGMENPRLTFVTPTILAGDKSLVSLISHELAHSWSGNLVTNATWSDFWLNEGVTTYVERRIQEALFGKQRSDMEFAIEIGELKTEMAKLQPKDQILHIDLKGRDPEDGVTLVPYVKGALLLRAIEDAVGRDKFDAMLRSYFESFAFQSITTENFEQFLAQKLPELKLNLKEWIYEPGLPASAPKIDSFLLAEVEDQVARFQQGQTMRVDDWGPQQWLHFLRSLPSTLTAEKMAALDKSFKLTASTNNEILDAWLILAIRHNYTPAQPAVEEFLKSVGRQKFIKPLYEEMAKTPAGKTRAKALFARNKASYHPIAAGAVEALLAK